MFNLFKKSNSNIPPNPPFRKGENERSLFERGRFLKEYFGLSHAMVIALVLFIAISIFGAIAGRPPKRRQLTKAPLLWAKLDGSLADENGSGSTFAYSAGKSESGSDYGITLKEGDNIQYGPGAAIDAGNSIYENWNPNQGTMNVWVQPSWAGNDNEAHWIWSADAGRIDTADANLVAYWKFDEGSENLAFDSSSNSNVGYLHGPALSFDGGDYVNLSDNISNLEGLNAGTYEGWFKTSAASCRFIYTLSDKDTSNDFAQFGVGDVSEVYSDESFWLFVRRDNLDKLGMVVRNGHTYYEDDKWHHFAISTGAGANFIIIDGVNQAITYYAGNAATNEFSNISNPDVINIGDQYISGSRAHYWNGQIDEVRIYNRALSATEVGQHYAGTFADESGLVGYWDMDENTGQYAYDSSGNDNTGTLGATSGSSTDDPTWVNYAPRWTEEGRFGEAVVFDGSDDELEINDINF